jgi:hypothetical protein
MAVLLAGVACLTLPGSGAAANQGELEEDNFAGYEGVWPPTDELVNQQFEYPKYPSQLDGTLGGVGDYEDDGTSKRGLFRVPTLLDPWFDLKRQVRESIGLGFSGSWMMLYQNYSSTFASDRDAVGSKLTLNFNWEILNRGKPNALVFEFLVEDRRALGTPLPPLQAGPPAGTIVPAAATYGMFDFGVTQYYLRQNLFDGRFQWAVGKLFAPNFINAYPFFDDNRQFLNQNFSISPTVSSPLRTFGLVSTLYPIENTGLYVTPAMYSANSTDTGWAVDNFFRLHEYFYQLEVGLTSLAGTPTPIQARGPMDPNNFHVTLWYKDSQSTGNIGLNVARGIAFNANFMVGDSVMPFLRGGYSTGWIIDANVSSGVGIRPPWGPDDLFGFGVGWARPTNRPLFRSQYTLEAFYRFMLTPNFAITPDLQCIIDPALTPALAQLTRTRNVNNVVWVVGLRTRLTF